VTLPPLPERGLLADLCREAAAREGIEPQLIEKDLYLTRLLWALGQELGEDLLLKGGTLLSKVDLGFFRMSEDADLVVPLAPSRQRALNVSRIHRVRGALKELAGAIGVWPRHPGGILSEKGAHATWALDYPSEFGEQGFQLDVSIRPRIRPARQVQLQQLLQDPLLGDYLPAKCWALAADEARAEKVRAAFTREAIRDYYDLDRIRDAGLDLTSRPFIKLVDVKLAELKQRPLSEQAPSFGLTKDRRRSLDASLLRGLPAVLRRNAPPFDLDKMLGAFDSLWGKSPSRRS
jgi:predicted nucleotidyltransferase component of viral defense system